MEWLVWLGTGLVAGLLALFVMYRSIPRQWERWLGALVLGVVGGLLGGWLTDLIGLEAVHWLGAIVVAFAGALIVLWLITHLLPGQRNTT
jgi:uncharacterized membrane protein YeaQ/YmgE (transglycosylase-associated protein family)